MYYLKHIDIIRHHYYMIRRFSSSSLSLNNRFLHLPLPSAAGAAAALLSPPSPRIFRFFSSKQEDFILAELLSITKGPNHWLPLRSVASELSDEALEVIGEHGGLKGFITNHSVEASSLFEIRPDGMGIPLISQKTQRPRENVLQSVLETDVDVPPPSHHPTRNDYYNSHHSNANSNHHHNNDEYDNNYHHHRPRNYNRRRGDTTVYHSPPDVTARNSSSMKDLSSVNPEDDFVLRLQRKLVSCIPSFATPLTEVVKYEFDKEAITVEDVKKFVEKASNSDIRSLTDLFVPFSISSSSSGEYQQQDPWKALLHRISSTTTASPSSSSETLLKDIEDKCFISLLAPFALSHRTPETDALFAKDYTVGDYDMCRLARYLSNDNFVSVSSLLNSNVPSLLQRPLMHVIAAYPLQFEYIPPNTKLPTSEDTFIASVADSSRAAFEKGCPPVHVEITNSSSNKTKDEIDDHSTDDGKKTKKHAPDENEEDLGCVRFILHPEELEHGLGGVPSRIRALSLDQLQELYKLIQDRSLDKETARREGARFGLNKVPTGMARVKGKHQVIRSIIRMRFPRGNPFFDRNVFAHYIFDHLPETKPITLPDFRENQLPEQGRCAAPLSSEYIQSYPHLFFAVQNEKNDWVLQRADASDKEKIEIKNEEDITEEDIVNCMWTKRPSHYQSEDRSGLSTMVHLLPMVVQNRARQLGGMTRIISRYPEQFELDANPEFFYWKKPPMQVLAKKKEEDEAKKAVSSITNKKGELDGTNDVVILGVTDVIEMMEEEKKVKKS